MVRALFTLGAFLGLLLTAGVADAADGDFCKGHADYDSAVNWHGTNPQCYVLCDSKAAPALSCDPFTLPTLDFVAWSAHIAENDGCGTSTTDITVSSSLTTTTDQEEWFSLDSTNSAANGGQNYMPSGSVLTTVVANDTGCTDLDVILMFWTRQGAN